MRGLISTRLQKKNSVGRRILANGFFQGLVCPFFSIAVLTACGQEAPSAHDLAKPQEAWSVSNLPERMSRSYEKTFAKLPRSATASRTPWSDTYWPSFKAGIAQRWQEKSYLSKDHFSYSLPTPESLAGMDFDAMKKLSPAEKLDIFRGRYDFPTVRSEWARTSPENKEWEGLCHGWAAAAIHYQEPKPVTLTNPDGIKIPFGSADVKALLTYFLAEAKRSVGSRSTGSRCWDSFEEKPESASTRVCRDVNAGTFHVVLANQIGLMDESFVVDVTHDQEVWNQPVYQYSSEIISIQGPSPGAAEDVAQEVLVETKLTYTVEVNPNWEALNGTFYFDSDFNYYRYRLELDRYGRIIGGEWLDRNFEASDTVDRPDFLWAQGVPEFYGPFLAIKAIYEKSIAPSQPISDNVTEVAPGISGSHP